jgi:hypothetical protein
MKKLGYLIALILLVQCQPDNENKQHEIENSTMSKYIESQSITITPEEQEKINLINQLALENGLQIADSSNLKINRETLDQMMSTDIDEIRQQFETLNKYQDLNYKITEITKKWSDLLLSETDKTTYDSLYRLYNEEIENAKHEVFGL